MSAMEGPSRGQGHDQHRFLRTAKSVVAAGRVAKSSYCDHAGWALKQGSIIKNWKKRYFVLKARELIYFASASPSGKGIEEKGRLKIKDVGFTPDYHNTLVVQGELKNQSLKFQVETNDESLEWFNMIRQALKSDAQAQAAGRAAAKNAAHQGWLLKEGRNFKTWKKRYMTLSGNVIKYHADANEPPLGEVLVNDVNISAARSFALDVYSDNNRIFRIAADSFAEIEAWDHALAQAIGKNSCFGDPYADKQAPFLGESFAEATICEGWLYKRGQRSTNWQKRYFMLKGFSLEYMESPGQDAKGRAAIVNLKLGHEGTNGIELELETGRLMSVSADTKDEMDRWTNVICDLLKLDPASLREVEDVTAARPTTLGSRLRGYSTPAPRCATSSSGSGQTSRNSDSYSSPSLLSPHAQQQASELSRSNSLERYKQARKTGWLRKQGQLIKNWKRRYFLVDGKLLYYFEQVNESPKGNGVVVKVEVNTSVANCLDIHLEGGRILRVAADSPQEIRSWYQHLKSQSKTGSNRSVGSNPTELSASTLEAAGLPRPENASKSAPLEPGRGWLIKKSKNFNTWRRRYFVLSGKRLKYFEHGESDPAPLSSGIVRDVTLGTQRPFCIDVHFRHGRILSIVASNAEEMTMWCQVLDEAAHSQARASDLESLEFDQDDPEDIAVLGDNPSENQAPASSSFFPAGRLRAFTATRSSSNVSDNEDEDSAGRPSLDSMRFDPSQPVVSGWLHKEGGTVRSWKQRFFTLHGTALCYFKSDSGPLLRRLTVCHIVTVRTKKLCLEITTESGRKLMIAADSYPDFDRWLAALHSGLAAEKEKKAQRPTF